jgi:hypothetical protein
VVAGVHMHRGGAAHAAPRRAAQGRRFRSAQRWLDAGAFMALVHDRRPQPRLQAGCTTQPSGANFDTPCSKLALDLAHAKVQDRARLNLLAATVYSAYPLSCALPVRIRLTPARSLPRRLEPVASARSRHLAKSTTRRCLAATGVASSRTVAPAPLRLTCGSTRLSLVPASFAIVAFADRVSRRLLSVLPTLDNGLWGPRDQVAHSLR